MEKKRPEILAKEIADLSRQVKTASSGNIIGVWRVLGAIHWSSDGASRIRTLRRKLERLRARQRNERGRT